MKIKFTTDPSSGAHYLKFGKGRKSAKTEILQTIHPMIILDRNKQGHVIGIEILETT